MRQGGVLEKPVRLGGSKAADVIGVQQGVFQVQIENYNFTCELSNYFES